MGKVGQPLLLSQPPDLMECKMAPIMFNVDLPFFLLFIHLFPFVVPLLLLPHRRPLPSPCERRRAEIQEGPAQTETAGGGKGKAPIRGDRSGSEWKRSTEPATLIESFLLLKERRKRKESLCGACSLVNSGAEAARWRGRRHCERLQLAVPPDAQQEVDDLPRKRLCSASSQPLTKNPPKKRTN